MVIADQLRQEAVGEGRLGHRHVPRRCKRSVLWNGGRRWQQFRAVRIWTACGSLSLPITAMPRQDAGRNDEPFTGGPHHNRCRCRGELPCTLRGAASCANIAPTIYAQGDGSGSSRRNDLKHLYRGKYVVKEVPLGGAPCTANSTWMVMRRRAGCPAAGSGPESRHQRLPLLPPGAE